MTKALAQATALLATALLAPPIHAQTCASDADCTQGMVCHSQTVSTCTGGTAAPVKCEADAVCDPALVTPPTCSDSTISQCVYRWQLPCNADADCGDGFLCQPSTVTTCSGTTPSTPGSVGTGTATASAGGGAATGTGGASSGGAFADSPVLTSPDAGATSVCTSSTSYPGTCRSKVTTCNTDADCPAPWTCVSSGVAVPIATPMPAPIDAGVVTSLPPDGTSSTATATATSTGTGTVSKTCQSPSSYPQTVGGSDGTGTEKTTGGLFASADGGVGNGTTPSVPATRTPSGDGTNTTATGTTATTTGGGGCNVVSGSLPSGAIVVIGLAVALALLTRKRDQD
jgi:hypothetical protein